MAVVLKMHFFLSHWNMFPNICGKVSNDMILFWACGAINSSKTHIEQTNKELLKWFVTAKGHID